MPREYIRMFISWLRLIVRNTAFRSYASVLSGLLRLFRHCQAVIGGKERAFQEPVLALSSQPTDQDKPTSVTLAVPSFGAPLQSQGSNAVASNAQSPQNSYAPWTSSSMPEPSITGVATPLYPVVPKQSSDITLIPIIPGQIKRYERIEFQDENQLYEVQKGPLDWSDALTSVSGWEPLTHPEGALFFYHSNHRVFTDVNVRTDEIAVKMGKIAEKAYAEARDAGIILHPSVELVLELMEEDGKEIWGYYFADHDRRVIFWFQVHRSSDLMGNVRGVKCNNHVRYALESQYWFVWPQKVHIELYPNKRFLPTDVVVRLKEIVMYIQADNITSETCLAPFSSDEVASMLSLMDPLMSSTNKEHEHSVWIVARFMGEFTNAKFVNFCGQPGARLDADQSLYRDSIIYSKNILLRVMNVILFGTPDAHNKALHKIWVDHIVVQPRWKNFINRLNSEWNGYTIFSTVMLAVDISFLAVPSVQNQTPAILVSYLSAFCAMGSLVVSLVLAAHVNDSRRDSAKSVASFMSGMSRSMLGLESLALMLSLPFALLIWGMILFAAALSIVIFRTSDIVTISIVSPIWAVIIVLATWPALAANDIHISHLSTWVTEQVSRSRSSRVATRSHA